MFQSAAIKGLYHPRYQPKRHRESQLKQRLQQQREDKRSYTHAPSPSQSLCTLSESYISSERHRTEATGSSQDFDDSASVVEEDSDDRIYAIASTAGQQHSEPTAQHPPKGDPALEPETSTNPSSDRTASAIHEPQAAQPRSDRQLLTSTPSASQTSPPPRTSVTSSHSRHHMISPVSSQPSMLHTVADFFLSAVQKERTYYTARAAAKRAYINHLQDIEEKKKAAKDEERAARKAQAQAQNNSSSNSKGLLEAYLDDQRSREQSRKGKGKAQRETEDEDLEEQDDSEIDPHQQQ